MALTVWLVAMKKKIDPFPSGSTWELSAALGVKADLFFYSCVTAFGPMPIGLAVLSIVKAAGGYPGASILVIGTLDISRRSCEICFNLLAFHVGIVCIALRPLLKLEFVSDIAEMVSLVIGTRLD